MKEELEFARKKVRNYYKETEGQNRKLIQLNEELGLKNIELEKANNKAHESEKLKSTFLANVSHEIRTPLNGILGFIQLIKQAKYVPEKIDEYFEIITYSGNQLMQTIDSILDISKLESGQLELNLSKCNIDEIFDDLIETNKINEIKHKETEFIVEIKSLSKGNDIFSDQGKIRQVLNIFIQNAYKFTKSGFIKLGVKETNDNLIFYVQDTGIGIDPDKFNIIFESFRQIDENRSRQYGGVGLGLSIAKGLVQLLNGEIWLKSELADNNEKQGGTTFYFSIPYQIQDDDEFNKSMNLNKVETLNWSARKILIVEDDKFSAEYLTEVLSATKVKLYYANNGNDAVTKAKQYPDLDLILMDIQLPGISGDKATQAIREFNKEIPIVAQTAHAMINDKENYITAGCTDYISKPIAVNELYSILCKYI